MQSAGIKHKFLEYLHNKGFGTTINSNTIKSICNDLNIEPIDLHFILDVLFDECSPYLNFTVIPTRNDGLNVIQCKYEPISDKDTEAVMDKLRITDYSQKNYDEVNFLINQFKHSVPDFMFYKICEFYYKIKESSLVDVDKVKYVYITEQYITANKISTEMLNSILTVGYALRTDDGVIKWKIFNDKELPVKEEIEEEKPKVIATSTMSIPDSANINNLAVSIKFLADKLLKEVGVEPKEELDTKALLKDLDDLFNEYESMEDWEKMKNTNTFINTWKEIRKEYFNDRD